MRGMWRPLAAILLIAATTIFLAGANPASADTPFSPIFSTNSTGDIEFVSNTVATCSNAYVNCAAAQSGADWNNNNVSANMIQVDIDGDPTTSTSSSANYTLPAGGSVLWAGLYWAGYYRGPHADKDDIKFSTPTSGGYNNVTASQVFTYYGSDDFYGAYVDVTADVAAGGSGTYTVGDIKVSPGYSSTHGGWTLVIVEYDPAEPWKNLTVNQGFQTIGPIPSATIPVTGFTAPPIGPVNAEIGIVASEGDRRGTGDYAEFNGVRLTDGNNPSNNFFNSTLSDSAVYQSGSNPLYPSNTLGYDADIVSTSGLVPPGSTSANVTVGTTGDWYWPMVVTTAIEIYVPNLTTNLEKTATDLNGEDLHPGDTIEYSIFFNNTGDDPAVDVALSDAIPAGTTYKPGSLQVIQDDSPTGPRTDGTGDDTAWFDGTAVNFNLGVGATASSGGEVAPLSQGGHGYEVRFQVTVDAGTENSDIKNEAEIDYIAKFINEPYNATSNETVQPVEPLVDLVIDKVDITDPVNAGEQITYRIDYKNGGPSTANNVVITDNLPAGTVFNASASDPTCSASGLVVTCSTPSMADGDSESLLIVVDVDGDLAATNVCNRASITSDTHEHELNDNVDKECTEIEREVDLTLEKTAPATVAAGDQFTYVVTVENNGPSDAQNVVVADALPSGVNLVSVTPSGTGTCTGTVNCDWSEIAAGGSETLTIVVEVPSGATDGTVFKNRAKTGSDDPDVDENDNYAEVDTEVVTEADLEVLKQTETSPVIAGESITYTLTATNNGPSDAQNVAITDPVPAGLTYVPSLSSTDCVLAAGVVTCSTLALADGDSTTFTLVFDVDDSLVDGASLTNTATIASDTDDPVSGNDTSQVVDTVTRQADLSIVKDDNTTTVDAGGQITYTIDYRNDGPSDASTVSITDTLPAGVTFDSSSDCTASGSTVTCAIGNVPNGGSGSVSFVVDVDSSLPDTTQLLNSASVSANETDPDPDDNNSEVTTDVDRTSNLIIEKDDLTDPVIAGESTTYRIKVTNLGPSTDTGVTLSDALPAGTTFVSTTDPTNCSHTAGTVTCAIGTMLPNATYTVDVVVDTDTNLSDGHILKNQATVVGDFSTLVDDSEETTVQTSADLAITKTAPATVIAGQSATYTISVFNDGPSDAQNVIVVDALPPGVTYTNHTVTQGSGTCTFTAPILTCQQSSLASQATMSIDIVVAVDDSLAEGTTLTNAAKTDSDTNDPDDANNNAQDDSTVERQADLEVGKTTITPSVLAGSTATFEVTVTNNGPSVASGVSITDTLPAGFTFNSSLSDSTCATGVTCTVGTDIAVGDSVTFTIVADVDSATIDGTYTNSATAAGNETDPELTNNFPTSDIDVAGEADLSITKVSDTTTFVPGTTGSYTITVENNGPSDAANILVTDILPTGLTFNAAGSDPDCVASTGTVMCTADTLAASGQWEFTLVVDIDADYTGDVVNTATVGSDTVDPDESNNSNTDTTTTAPEADLSIVKSAPTDVVAGETLTYSIVVRNDGPSDAVATEVVDSLPAGLTFVSTGSSPQCSATGQTVTCSLATMEPGDTVILSIVTAVDTSVPHLTTIVNSATVDSDTHDPDGSDNTSETETESSREVDIAIDKTASAETVVAGTSFTYTIVVTNAGPSDASDVSVSDVFPAGITATAVTTDFGICGNNMTGFGCSAASMAPTDVMTITVTAEIDESVANGTTLTNTAYAVTADPDTNDANNNDSADVDVDTQADLSVEKTADVEDVIAGEPLTYTITVTNNGPSDAQNVELIDNVPTSLLIDSVSSADMTCTVTGQLVECDTASLADGATATVTVNTTVDENTADSATVSNTASVTSSTDDPNEDNNSAEEQTGVDKLVDLELAKTTTKPIAGAGETHPYEIEVTNAGPSSATNVTITDTLPAGTTLNTSLSDVSCSAVSVTVTCTIASITAGGTASVNIVIDIPADHPDGGTITNAASVVSNEADSDPDNNSDEVTTTVTNSADLGIVKDGDGAATAGLPYTWTLAVTNNGPSDAVNTIVTDTLPTGTAFNAAASDSRCSAIGQVVTCTIPVLAANTDTDFVIAVDVDSSVAAAADLENAAGVSSDTDDPNTDNDNSSDTATVARDSDIDITKRDLTDPVIAGQQIQWEITVDNRGPSDANNVTIADPIPTGFNFVSVDNTSDCSYNSGSVNCLFPTIVDGASETIVITADVSSNIDDAQVIGNTATADSDSSDPVSDEEETTVQRRSDLRIEKTSDEAAIAGTNQTYTITVTNDGPSDADNVEVVDYLPAGVNYVSSTLPGCSPVAATVECDLGDIANSGSVTFDIVVFITDAAGTAPRNVVEVDSDSVDPDESNNIDDDTTTVTFEADLVIAKSLVTDLIVPGESATWEIVVTNNGPSIANNVEVTDTLATGLTFAAVGSDPACSAVAQDVTCVESDLISGESKTFTLVTDIDSSLVGTLGNTASVTSSTPDPDSSSNTAEAEGELSPQADMSIQKTSTTATITAGENITYNVVANNGGSSDALNVVITDPVPANTTFVSALSSSNCSLAGVNVVCTIPVVPAGEEAAVVLTFELASGYPDSATLTNSVVVDSDTPDPDTDNNGNSDDTPVETSADIGLVKSGPSEAVGAGEEFDYTITLTNDGPSDAQNVDIIDTLPAGTTFVSVDDAACSETSGTITCSYPTVADGDELVITITVLADSTLVEGSTITNEASAESDTNDPNEDNNNDTQDSTIERTADLEVTKTATPQPVIAGTQLVYTLTVVNNGPAISDNVEISDVLPTGTTFVSADAGCGHLAGTVTCSAGSLDVGDVAEYAVTVLVDADVAETPSMVNSATATGDDSPESTETEEVEVQTEADLSLAKTLNDDLVAGEEATYTLTLLNAGPSDAQNVVITDALPSGLTYVSDTFGCDVTGSAISCDVGTVANGAGVTIELTVMVEPWVADGFVLTNNAGVESDTYDPDAANNTASDSDDTDTAADLSITKTLDGETLGAGQQAVYNIEVHNDGPSDAQNVIVTDALPAGLIFQTVGSDSSCIGSTSVTCSLGVLAAGETYTLTIVVDVDASAEGPIVNTATVASETLDPDDTNNSVEETSDVSAVAEVQVEKLLIGEELTPGTEVDWTITIENIGPATATDVTVNDILPADLSYVSHSIAGNGIAATGDDCVFAGSAVSCLFDVVEVGDVITITITTLVDPSEQTDEIINTATVSSPEMVEAAVSVVADTVDPVDARLVVDKVGPTGQVTAGDEFDWTITVRNEGPDPMTVPFTVADNLPAGLTYISHSASSSGSASPVCDTSSSSVSCEVQTLNVDESVTLVVTTRAEETGSYQNVATVDAAFLADPEPVRSSATTAVEATDTIAGLAFTGGELTLIVGAGAAAIAVGAGLVVGSRRRGTHGPSKT